MNKREQMKTAEAYKNEFQTLKNNIEALLKKTNSKFTVEEFLNFDSISYTSLTTIELNLDPKLLKKQDYLILANEKYSIVDENFKNIEKKIRTTIFSIKKNRLLKLTEEEVFSILFDYIKLIETFKRYKILRKDLDNYILLHFPEITTWLVLFGLYGMEYCLDKIKEFRTDEYWYFIELQNKIQEEERMAYMIRSSKLEEKLKNKKEEKF
jgi:hypothetical protein